MVLYQKYQISNSFTFKLDMGSLIFFNKNVNYYYFSLENLVYFNNYCNFDRNLADFC